MTSTARLTPTLNFFDDFFFFTIRFRLLLTGTDRFRWASLPPLRPFCSVVDSFDQPRPVVIPFYQVLARLAHMAVDNWEDEVGKYDV